MTEKQFKVRAAHCDYRATEEEIYQTLRRITDPLTKSWKPIENAKKVVKVYDVPGGGSMFDRYTLSACFEDADAVISVAKIWKSSSIEW